MRIKPFAPWLFVTLLLIVSSAGAAEVPEPVTWHPQSLAQAIANMLVFAVLGIAIAVMGFKVFDKCTPGELTKEIIENQNIAAAIVGGAVILGVCLIVAAAMIG